MIQINGNEKKLKQLFKELLPRCKADKLDLQINFGTETEVKDLDEVLEVIEKNKKGRKPKN